MTPMCDHPNREAAMVILRRDHTGKGTVWCDPCIAPLVDALNNDVLQTVASCCGHGQRDGSIILADGRELVIRRFVPYGAENQWTDDELMALEGDLEDLERTDPDVARAAENYRRTVDSIVRADD